jgi:chemotaxis protein methyltransferase CheR
MEERAPGVLDAGDRISEREFSKFSALAREKFGLELRQGKEELVSTRLRKKMREVGIGSFREYYDFVLADRTGDALIAMIDALATNHTSFLRERAHFDFLRTQLLPEIAGRAQFTIWSAACSTGEEPYTIAFTLLDALGPRAAQRARILATDISTKALNAAAQGVFANERLEGLPMEWRRKFLLRGERKWEGFFRVRPEVSAMISFRRLNLIEPLPQMGPMALVFCRNVMIYFDRGTQEGLVNRITEKLDPGGYLFVGHSESLSGIQHELEYVSPAIYRKRGRR